MSALCKMMSREWETSHKWEKIFLKDTSDKELLYKIYKGHLKHNNKKKTTQKMGQRIKQTPCQRRWQISYEKMLHVVCHQENAN